MMAGNTTSNYQADTPPPPQNATVPPAFGGHDHSFTLQAIMELQKSHGEMKEGLISARLNLSQAETRLERQHDKLEAAIEKGIEKNEQSFDKICRDIKASIESLDTSVNSHGKKISNFTAYCTAAAALIAVLGVWMYGKFVDDVANAAAKIVQEQNSDKK